MRLIAQLQNLTKIFQEFANNFSGFLHKKRKESAAAK